MKSRKIGLVTKNVSSMTTSWFAVNVKWHQKIRKTTPFFVPQKTYFPYFYRSKVLICHSKENNETFCSEKPSVAIILRLSEKNVHKMSGLDWMWAVRCEGLKAGTAVCLNCAVLLLCLHFTVCPIASRCVCVGWWGLGVISCSNLKCGTVYCSYGLEI